MFKPQPIFSALVSTSLIVSPVLALLSGQLSALSQEDTGTTSDPLKVLRPAFLKVCNQMNGGQLSVAIAQYKEGGWNAKGWWTPAPNDCRTIALGPYDGQLLYYASGGGKEWTASNTFCVNRQQRFDIPNSQRNSRSDCPNGLAGVGMRSISIRSGQKRTLTFKD